MSSFSAWKTSCLSSSGLLLEAAAHSHFPFLVPLGLMRLIRALFKQKRSKSSNKNCQESVSPFLCLEVPQLLVLDPLVGDVLAATSSGPLLNHDPMSILNEMPLPRDSLHLSLFKTGTRILG